MCLRSLAILARSYFAFERAPVATAVRTFIDEVAPLRAVAQNEIRNSPVGDPSTVPVRVGRILRTCDFDRLQFVTGDVRSR